MTVDFNLSLNLTCIRKYINPFYVLLSSKNRLLLTRNAVTECKKYNYYALPLQRAADSAMFHSQQFAAHTKKQGKIITITQDGKLTIWYRIHFKLSIFTNCCA